MKPKKKLNDLDKYVIFSIAWLLVFTIAEFIKSFITGIEDTALIAAVFAAFGGEIFSCAMIKRYKLKRGDGDAV